VPAEPQPLALLPRQSLRQPRGASSSLAGHLSTLFSACHSDPPPCSHWRPPEIAPRLLAALALALPAEVAAAKANAAEVTSTFLLLLCSLASPSPPLSLSPSRRASRSRAAAAAWRCVAAAAPQSLPSLPLLPLQMVWHRRSLCSLRGAAVAAGRRPSKGTRLMLLPWREADPAQRWTGLPADVRRAPRAG